MTAMGRPVPAGRTVSVYGPLLLAAILAVFGVCVSSSGGHALGSGAHPLARGGHALGRGGDRLARGGHALARDARTVHLQEHGRLRFVSERGSTLIERGTAYGTYTATMVADLTIHSKSVTAYVTIYPRGGSITASAVASYRIVKNLGYFGGTLTLGRGSGRYSHIAEVNRKPLGISGIINRENFEAEVKASGEASGI